MWLSARIRPASICLWKSANPPMTDNPAFSNPDFAKAFAARERQERISTGKVASLLVLALMPLGSIMDWLVYHPQRWYFLELRILCSLLAGLFLYLPTTPVGEKHNCRLRHPHTPPP